jgi:hypothetical protein
MINGALPTPLAFSFEKSVYFDGWSILLFVVSIAAAVIVNIVLSNDEY